MSLLQVSRKEECWAGTDRCINVIICKPITVFLRCWFHNLLNYNLQKCLYMCCNRCLKRLRYRWRNSCWSLIMLDDSSIVLLSIYQDISIERRVNRTLPKICTKGFQLGYTTACISCSCVIDWYFICHGVWAWNEASWDYELLIWSNSLCLIVLWLVSVGEFVTLSRIIARQNYYGHSFSGLQYRGRGAILGYYGAGTG